MNFSKNKITAQLYIRLFFTLPCRKDDELLQSTLQNICLT
jgi:hypothetical protein